MFPLVTSELSSSASDSKKLNIITSPTTNKFLLPGYSDINPPKSSNKVSTGGSIQTSFCSRKLNNNSGSYLQSIKAGIDGMSPMSIARSNTPQTFVPNIKLIRNDALFRCPQPIPAFHARSLVNDVRRLDMIQKRLECLQKIDHVSQSVPLRSSCHASTSLLPAQTSLPNCLPNSVHFSDVYHTSSENHVIQSTSNSLSGNTYIHVSRFNLLTSSDPLYNGGLTDSRIGNKMLNSQFFSLTSTSLLSTEQGNRTLLVQSRTLTVPTVTDACVSPITSTGFQPCTLASESLSSTSSPHVTPLPRLNMRHANVKRYPKYNTRRNSGFDRRLRHTGLILDARVTLRLLRKMLQPFVNQAMDKVLQHYMQEYIGIAVKNIRENLGEESVSEDDLARFQRSIMRRVALQYLKPSKHSTHNAGGPSLRENKSRTDIGESHVIDTQLSRSTDCELSLNSTNLSPTSESRSMASCENESSMLVDRPSSLSMDLVIGNNPHISTSIATVICNPLPSRLNERPTNLCASITPLESPSSVSSGSTLGFFHSTSDDSTPPSPTERRPVRKSQCRGRFVIRQRRHVFARSPAHFVSKQASRRVFSGWREARSKAYKTNPPGCLRGKRTSSRIGRSTFGSVNPPDCTSLTSNHQSSDRKASDAVDTSGSSPSGHSVLMDVLPRLDFTPSTQFTLGSSANTWLGLGAARGRIYTKYPELFRYQCDPEDKSWLYKHRLLTGHGVKAYLMHADQIRLVAKTMGHCDTTNLQTFVLPPWILAKVAAYASSDLKYSHMIANPSIVNGMSEAIEVSSQSPNAPHTTKPVGQPSFSKLTDPIEQPPVMRDMSLQRPVPNRQQTTSSADVHHSASRSPNPPTLQRFDCC